ncbi:MAG: flagellar export chaperone FliS [Candidatus Nitrohelix vancouverensis]|uniref:Flagellar secretion chaperone FliS n=1 Tax=Candidatus Nitrohelix vancouverensis TaxID=2705534 RepID=A0A7T0C2S2_9BACT|nr:MAG: flagellar export chaperone FliS [Candidatus Nitrohelix vancouverensis]
MVPSNFHYQYRKNEISTSNQGKLIIMMYEGAIKFSSMALNSMNSNDIAKKSLYIRKTHDIINELSLALDRDKGGDVANKLESLYQFIIRQLTLANIKSDKKALESVIRVLTPLLEAWQQLLSQEEDQGEAKPIRSITSKC